MKFTKRENLNKITDLGRKFVNITGTDKISAAMLLMCGDHGIAKHNISAFKQEVTLQMMQGYNSGTAAANVLASYVGADIFVVDVGTLFDTDGLDNIRSMKVEKGTNDFSCGPAMSLEQVKKAISVGVKVTEDVIAKGYNVLITAEMGIGNTTSSSALISAMLEINPHETVGRGSGIDDKRLMKKIDLVFKGLRVNNPKIGDGLDCLRKLGGFEHAALVGAIMACKDHHVAIILDGINASAAALCAYGIDKNIVNYLFASHLSVEPSHSIVLNALGLYPSIHADMRLGEGTGACLFLPILRKAVQLI